MLIRPARQNRSCEDFYDYTKEESMLKYIRLDTVGNSYRLTFQFESRGAYIDIDRWMGPEEVIKMLLVLISLLRGK